MTETRFEIGDHVEFIDDRSVRGINKGDRFTVEATSEGLMGQLLNLSGHCPSVYARRFKKVPKIEPGMKVRVSGPAFTRPDGTGGVHLEFYGKTVTVLGKYDSDAYPDCWRVERKPGHSNAIHEKYLTPVEDEKSAPTEGSDLEEFKHSVARKARELAKEHDWCSVVDRALSDLGLADYGRGPAPEGWEFIDNGIRFEDSAGDTLDVERQPSGKWAVGPDAVYMTPAQLRAAADYMEAHDG